MKTTLCISFILLALWGNAQPATPYKNLVFEGAGIRGLAYGGAIEVLEEKGVLAGIEKVGGTSAGAITAMLLALGYSASEITELVYRTRFNRFNSGRFFFVGGLYRMHTRYGWYRGDKFSAWLENAIRHKTGNADITFADLRAQGYKDLYITATCLNRQQLLVFSAESYPHMKIKDAVRISMSVPLYFEAVFIDQTGRVIPRPTDTRELDLVMDGGITANFPLFLFDSTVQVGQQTQRLANPATLGIRIDTDTQIALDRQDRSLEQYPISSLQGYMQAFYVYVLESLNRPQLTEADWQRTISVSSAGVGPRVKRLSMAQKQALLDSGRTGVLTFLTSDSP
ncbi:patatin-like phospholipase family protein [Cesiribacter andamanensis]|nr:patatin-like phospholipase family protein [Cesiribacter andamanensis]